MNDKKIAEDIEYAAVIEKRKNEPTVALDDYLAKRSEKKKIPAGTSNKVD